MRMPALKASRIPLTMLAVVLSGLYDARTPSPAATPTGVVIPYRHAPRSGTQLYLCGSDMSARREPTPSPSNVSDRHMSGFDGPHGGDIGARTVKDEHGEQDAEIVCHSEREADEETTHVDE